MLGLVVSDMLPRTLTPGNRTLGFVGLAAGAIVMVGLSLVLDVR